MNDAYDINVPLIVDMDETLIRTDSILEALRAAGLRHPKELFHLHKKSANWLKFKEAVHDLTRVDQHNLPVHTDVLTWVKEQQAQGRRVVLATASTYNAARDVMEAIGLKCELMASGNTKLKGDKKRKAIEDRFGSRYMYIGDTDVDKHIWEGASAIGAVHPSAKLKRWIQKQDKPHKIWLPTEKAPFIKATRPHQWIKNVLIFLPIMASHSWSNPHMVGATILMFLAFCLIASATYIINDFVDLEDDRAHPRKKNRPLASGAIRLDKGILLCLGLMAASLVIASIIGFEAIAMLAIYTFLTLTYSFKAKTKPIIDVIMLSTLYSSRIIAGVVVTGLVITPWLLLFSFFLFLSLATAKRVGELKSLGSRKESRRGYTEEDLVFLQTTGIATGLSSTVILGLYTAAPDVVALYTTPNLLFGAVVGLVLWVLHVWFQTHKGNMSDDPIVFAFKDRLSLLLGTMTLAFFVLAV